MTLAKLPSLSIVITLFFQSILALGETLLTPEANKDGGLKITEKRINNFRVPMEMPYDPNFWPARGRRSRRNEEKTTETNDCITEDGFSFDKTRIQCQEFPKIHEEKPLNGKLPALDFEIVPPSDSGDDIVSSIEKTGNCYGNEAMSRVVERPKGRLGVKVPDILDEHFLGPKKVDEIRRKKQKHSFQPQLIFYGNGVYWEPESLFGEKKKKQDVFWVARGKKNLNLNYP